MKDASEGTPALKDAQLPESRGVRLMIPETGKLDLEASSLSSRGRIRGSEEPASRREDARDNNQS